MHFTVDHARLDASIDELAADFTVPETTDDGIIDDLDGIASLIGELSGDEVFTLADVPAGTSVGTVMVTPTVTSDTDTYTIDLLAQIPDISAGELRETTLFVHAYGWGNRAGLWLPDTIDGPADVIRNISAQVAADLNFEWWRQRLAVSRLTEVWTLTVAGIGRDNRVATTVHPSKDAAVAALLDDHAGGAKPAAGRDPVQWAADTYGLNIDLASHVVEAQR